MEDYNRYPLYKGADKTDVICDIDGTIMNVEDRLALAIKNKRPEDKRMNWDIFLDPKVMEAEDRPNWDVVFLIKKLMSTGSTILFTSANNRDGVINLCKVFKKSTPAKFDPRPGADAVE